MMRFIRSKAPLRLGLAGGGTDVSPYCDEFGGCVLNATIDLYAHCTIEPNDDGVVEFAALDRKTRERHAAATEYPLEGPLGLHRAVLNRIVADFLHEVPQGHRVSTHCDAPAGSGLGSSSTLVVAMIKAYAEWLQLPLGDYDVASLAYRVERLDLGQQGGRQDQYAATFGGFNFIEFYADERVIVNPLRVKEWIVHEFESSLLLYFTGTSRESSAIIARQVKNIRQANEEAVEATHALKRDALACKEALLKGQLTRFAEVFRHSWEAKKKLADSISTSEIEQAVSLALSNGAISGKVSGAGGGGFIMFMVDPLRRLEVAEALKSCNGVVVPVHFSSQGATAWTGVL